MAEPKRTEFEAERDRAEIARRYVQGHTQQEIADYLNTTFYPDNPISRQQVSYDVRLIIDRWVKSSVNHMDQKRAIELAKVDQLEREYYDAWVRSCQDFTETITDLTGNPGEQGHVQATRGRRHIRTYHRDGNPVFLQGVLDCIKKRCELLGLDAPKKQFNFDLTSLDDEQLERIAAGEDLSNVLKRGTPPGGG